MKRILTAIVGLCLIATAATAFYQSRDSNYNQNVVSGGGGSPTFTGAVAGASSTCGFSASCPVTITATAGVLVVMVGGQNVSGASSTITGVATSGTCGVVSFTLDVAPTALANNAVAALAHGTVSSGSCTVTATASAAGTFQGLAVAGGSLNNLSSSTPSGTCNLVAPGTQGSPYACTAGLTIASGGFAVLGAIDDGNATFSAGSSTIAVDAQALASTIVAGAIGHSSTAGSITPDIATTGFNNVVVASGTWR